jgi:type II secretory ATPase GspE/PulE/Tfp pilus assembly ATPase PilB-like protein
MKEPMKTSGPRLALLFRQVGLLGDADWEKHFKNTSKEKGLMDILVQDVSWQTFVDLAKLEIRLPSRRRRSPATLPDNLTQAIHIHAGEILDLLEKHQPDMRALCAYLVGCRSALRPRVDEFLKNLEAGKRDPYRTLLDEEILTPEILAEAIARGDHSAARRNREWLALEILSLNGFVNEATREKALADLGRPDGSLAQALAGQDDVSSSRIAKASVEGMALPTVDLTEQALDERSRVFCPVEFLRRELFLPVEADGMVRVATADPLNLSVADLLAILTGRTILLCYAPPGDIIAAINRIFPEAAPVTTSEPSIPAPTARPQGVPKPPQKPPAPPRAAPRAEARTDAPQKAAPAPRPAEPMARIVDTMSTVELVSSMIESAVATRATDIHLEPQARGLLRVRFRIDGQLHNVMNVPADLALPVISRIKVLANMNVTERRRPQDGHFSLEMEKHEFDFRVSAMPSHLGEKLVLRILEQATVLKGLRELGLTEPQQEEIARLVTRPYGLLLVTGPTGSGKTTTLYSALSTINQPGVNITTIEDPVEYQLEGITQVQVDYAIDLDFASGLRAALRQDPDIIMVGEIRDNDTARIAIRAALTGHLVLSTLHTNNAAGAITALSHMGIQPYLIACALTGAVAQRLVKKICAGCKQTFKPTKSLLHDLGMEETAKRRMYRGRGCGACLNTGHSGRTGVFEVFHVTEPVRYLIMEQASEDRVETLLREHGFRNLRENALDKVFEGITSPEEVLRAVYLSD